MSLYQSLIKDTRFLLIASASGIAILSQQLPSHALDSVFSKPRGAVVEQPAEPGRLQFANSQTRSISTVSSSSGSRGQVIQTQHQQSDSAEDRVKSLYGSKTPTTPKPLRPAESKPIQQRQVVQRPTPTQQQVAQNQQQSQISQTAGTRVGRRSLFDRLVGKVRGDNSNPLSGPPRDPGMRYTTASQAAQQKQRVAQQEPKRFVPPPVPGVGVPTATNTAQSAGKFIPPPVPGVSEKKSTQTALAPTPSGNVVKPRLFPTSEDANPIEHPLAMPKRPPLAPPVGFLPPAPSVDGEQTPAIPQGSVATATDSGSDTPQSFPELKAILEGTENESPEVAVTPVPASPPVADSTEWKKTSKGKEAATVTTLVIPKSDPTTSDDFEKKLPNLELELKSASSAQKSQALTRNVVAVPSINELEIPSPADLQAPMPAPEPKVTANVDPLANPFPEDTKQVVESGNDSPELVLEEPVIEESKSEASEPTPVADVAELKAPAFPSEAMEQESEEPQETEEPYTGLALEQNLFLKTQTPAPAEPQAEANSTESEVAAEEVITAKTDTLPQLPLLPLPELEVVEQPEEMKESAPELPLVAEEEVSEDVSTEEPGRATLTRSDQTPELKAPEASPKTASLPKKSESKHSKMELISSRKDLTGLKGFCSVSLRDSRDLVDVQDEFAAIFNGKEYSFASTEALEKFTADPGKYAPAIRGSDVIHLSLTGEEVEGSLDHAVWYKGRLYLFTSVETMETFVAAPSSHATDL